ncbi:thiosulfate oxidation carrier protein SoxY [Ideonella livida]|uniref:Thiosulfate oxidation carrier protein SoxY n=1 Tax=Ideonella livida TaxID=2707176 RepID=A0A7C9TKX5_9BURK|nr:thiosulfate oxidation carrier protein SoxY [Ideonella livida]NDY92818.1 thiosulfate oxidation carrier protein SoxY [Ideonella livida]
MHTRREALAHTAALTALLAGTGLWPAAAQPAPPRPASASAPPGSPLPAWPAAAFAARPVAAVYPALGLPVPEPSALVSLRVPALAEDGTSVAVSVSVAVPAGAPGVQRLLVLVAHNPVPLAAVFEVGDAVAPQVALRVKMAQDTAVYAVAVLADGRALYARQEVTVALGGCGQTV